jgi:cobalt-zinc-cadmium efflux system outer membrane protein
VTEGSARVVALAGVVAVLHGAGACTPSRAEMAEPIAMASQERLGVPVRWRGADAIKDRAVDDAVRRRLSRPLDADAAVEIALVRHPAMQVAFASLGLAQADLVDAGLLANPHLSLGAAAAIEGGTVAGVDVDVGVEQSFLSLVFLAQRTSIAEARRDAARSRTLDVALRVAADARRAFVDAVTSAALARLALADLEAEEAIVVFVRANVAAGNQTRLDLAIGEARYQQAVVAAGDAEREARVAREALLAALGLWGAAAAEQLVKLPEGLSTPTAPRIDDLERTALVQNARLAARRAALDAEARALGYVDVARFLPDLEVGVAVGIEHHGERSVGPEVGIGIPLFNQGQGELLRRRSALALEASSLAQDAIALRTRARQAAVVADNAMRRAAQIEAWWVPALGVVVDEMERRLNGMLVTPEPLLAARRAGIEGERTLVLAKRDAWRAMIDVEQLRQGGTPDSAVMATTSPAASARPEHGGGGH